MIQPKILFGFRFGPEKFLPAGTDEDREVRSIAVLGARRSTEQYLFFGGELNIKKILLQIQRHSIITTAGD
jgi:hypothetical protein